MLNDDTINKLSERLALKIDNITEYILKEIGNNVKSFKGLTTTQAIQLGEILKYGGNYEKIVNKLAQLTELNVNEINEIFKEVAKKDNDFAKQFYEYRNKKYIPYEENIELQRQVEAIRNITTQQYLNMSNTSAIGFMIERNGEKIFEPLRQVYTDTIDKAILSIQMGTETFDKAMYRTLKDLGNSGLKTIAYESGRTMRLDSAVSMNIKGALTDLHNEIQLDYGKEFNADGVEVNVHENPAPDHQYVQGKQFSLEEFYKFQNNQDSVSYDGVEFPSKSEETGHDRRSIGEYNCYHYIYSIILGVSNPEYSNEQLQEIIDRNNKGFDFDGKHYNMYEGEQLQRRLETEIRKAKDNQIIGVSSGNKDLINDSQLRITTLTRKYNELSKASGLKTKMNRLRVSGYKKS